MAISFLIAKNIPQWVLSNHGHFICLEVLAELSGRNQDCIQELLDLQIPSLGLIQDFTDEIDWALDLVCMSCILSFNNNSCANHLGGCCNVDQEGLIRLWRYHDRRCCQEKLELGESLVGLRHPGETLLVFKQHEER